ncbi:MAG: type II toxin-antitoxin system VapC family toxin, partial [Chloroflexota bacterium]|nr:type II toxin-antitoxin system VapC family toxin [Chloroflexota bacterium]
ELAPLRLRQRAQPLLLHGRHDPVLLPCSMPPFVKLSEMRRDPLGEVANALYRRIHRGQHALTRSEAAEALGTFLAFPLHIVSTEDLYTRSFDFAVQAGLPSIYDSMYVVLAQSLGAELWTDDRRLLNSVAQISPWVRWIGHYRTGSGA